jgi:hypothetical protein
MASLWKAMRGIDAVVLTAAVISAHEIGILILCSLHWHIDLRLQSSPAKAVACNALQEIIEGLQRRHI